MKAFVSDSAVVERRIRPLAATESAVVESDPTEGDCFAKFCNKTERTGAQYYKTTLKFKRDCERRRGHGAGRHRVCPTVREMLAEWYNIIRHSVDVKIMCRFPKKVLLVQALILQEDYYVSCIKSRIGPGVVKISCQWINAFLDEYRISQRMRRIESSRYREQYWRRD